MDPLKAEQFQSALRDLLASDAFQRSPALGRLLTYLVERTLAGESATLKESVIGHELYDRPASYDPKLDSVVRVSANRLRVRLEDHYRANPDQPLRLVLPKGSYVPLLEVRKPAVVQETAAKEPEQVSLQATAEASEPDVAPLWAEQLATSRKHQAVFFSVLAGAVLLCALFWIITRRPTPAVVAEPTWSVRPFARLGGSQQFGAFSPDGTRLAFNSTSTSDENKVVYIQSIASEEAQRIAPGLRPAWSPDGKRLAFLRPEPHGKEQVIVRTLETGQEDILAELEGLGSWLCQIPRLAWSTDGRVIYTTSSAGHGTVCGLISIDIASRRITPLLPPASPGGDLEPAISPDGSTIAFMRGLGSGASDIFLMSASGGEAHRLTSDGTDLLGFDWTPDGKWLIVASTREGGVRRLWRFPASGDGAPGSLLDGMSDPGFPSVSSAGKEIAFTQFHTTAPIWRADARGSTQLLDNQSRNLKPAVSADGKWLLYSSNRAGKEQLWVSHLDGSEARPLMPRSQFESGAARWSPDATNIAMECHLAKRTHICLSRADGNGFRQLTNGDASQFHPSWSHDGRFVYFTSDSGGGGEIYRMDVRSGAVLQVTHQGGHRALESADGKWIFIDLEQPAGGLMALPATGTETEWRAAENGRVLSHFHSYSGTDWDISRDGVVYVEPLGENAPRLSVFDLETRTSRPLFSLREARTGDDISLGIMPDGKGVIYTVTHTSSELTIMSARK